MCGIFGYIGNRKDSANIVLNGLKSLEYRGYDSWGVAVVPEFVSRINLKKNIGKIGQAHVDELEAGSIAFGHTRWATHGGVTDLNAHPHLDCTGNLAVIHNGIVENYHELKEKLMNLGHKFISETDSEVVVHLVEDYEKSNSLIDSIKKTFEEIKGLNAFIVINADEKQLIAVRRGSPLVVGFGEGENYLASDPAALLGYTKTVYFVEDGEMVIVNEKQVDVFDCENLKQKEVKRQNLSWDVSQSQKGEHPYYMIKEIYEQGQIINSIANSGNHYLDKISEDFRIKDKIYLIGCGTAANACHVGYYLFSKIAGKRVNWSSGSEFHYNFNDLTPNSLVFALSQSGETMDILEPLRVLKENGTKIVALVNVLGSSLYRLADEKILLGAGPEKAVASTKAFTAKLAHLILLGYASANKIEEGKQVLLQASVAINKVLSEESKSTISELAKILKDKEHLYCLGRGISYPLSMESALKIKEISYIHAEGIASGELKHGTLALIEKGTPCLVFLPNDETYKDNLAGAMEVKARGGYVIGISSQPNEVFDYYVEVTDCQEATIIPNVVVAQLLAYYLTLERNLDPDMPRNLAKSVTVK